MNQNNLAVIMMSVDTLERLALRVLSMVDISGEVTVVSHKPGERTASENFAEAMRVGASSGKEWVLFLEDDIEVCEDFIDGVIDWLMNHATDDRRVYSFSVPHQAMNACRTAAWDCPIEYFCCTQAFALRAEDAASLHFWMKAHPTFTGPDGNTSTGAYDLSMREWAKATWPDIDHFLASNPSLVQHVGDASVLTPGRELVTMPTYNREGVRRKPRLLWVGDAACPSGFARSTHGVLDTLHHTYDVTVLGINYNGDPHKWPYPIYAAAIGGDAFGVKRLIWMCDAVKPDIIVIQQDPWNFPYYLKQLAKFTEYRGIPVIGVVAVDGKNCRGAMLNGLSLAIFWTQFGLDEARLGGYVGPAAVVPLGVDLQQFYPVNKREARKRLGLPDSVLDTFIVGNVNRNQPRKRLDLMIEYFAEWKKRSGVKDAALWMHVAPTGDTDGIDCQQYAKWHGVDLLYAEPTAFYGVSENEMRDTYSAFDVSFTASQGEGFGFSTFESMACGTPVIASDWAALGELCKNAAYLVPCTSTSITMNGGINSVGGVMDKEQAIKALDALYRDYALREDFAVAGLRLVKEPRFRWENVGRAFSIAMDSVLGVVEPLPSVRGNVFSNNTVESIWA